MVWTKFCLVVVNFSCVAVDISLFVIVEILVCTNVLSLISETEDNNFVLVSEACTVDESDKETSVDDTVVVNVNDNCDNGSCGDDGDDDDGDDNGKMLGPVSKIIPKLLLDTDADPELWSEAIVWTATATLFDLAEVVDTEFTDFLVDKVVFLVVDVALLVIVVELAFESEPI